MFQSTIKFPVKINSIHKIEKKEFYQHWWFCYENKAKYPIFLLKKCFEEIHVDLILLGEGNMFLSKISTHLCMITHYIMEENMFVVIVYNLLVQTKY